MEKCVAVICGTGSVAYVREDNEFHRIGGWGYFLDDTGSGFTIGRDALRAALEENEGTGEKTAVTALVEGQIGAGVWDRIDMIYSEGVDYIASFPKQSLNLIT